jgi:flagellar biosynthesis/type III secretory pathway chaperone
MLAAANRLAELLAEENAALAAADIPRAIKLVEAKAEALASLHAMLPLSSPGTTASGSEEWRQAEQLSRRLQHEMIENRKLLEQAIQVQSRIIGMIARAMPRALAASAPRYGAKGVAQHLRQAIAVSSRA